jgi:hypothetical protein
MALTNLLNNVVLDTSSGEGVNGNGIFRLYESPIIANQNRNSLEVIVRYGTANPDPLQGGTSFMLTSWVETVDSSDQSYVFHNQFEPYLSPIQGATHRLVMEENLVILDPGVIVDIWNGQEVAVRESRKGGKTPDNFRVVIAVIENGFGTAGAFQSIPVSCSYRIY